MIKGYFVFIKSNNDIITAKSEINQMRKANGLSFIDLDDKRWKIKSEAVYFPLLEEDED